MAATKPPTPTPAPAGRARGTWTPTRALARAVGFGGALLLLSVVLGRLDLALLAVPIVLGTGLSLTRSPTTPPTASLTTSTPVAAEGTEVTATLVLADADPGGYDFTLTRLTTSTWTRPARGERPHLALGGVPEREIRWDLRARRWGRHRVGPAVSRAIACDGLLVGHDVHSGSAEVSVYPLAEPFTADESMPAAAGMVGQHRSRRPGDGGELSAVRRFAAGDRLRRIDWRVTLRTGEPHIVSSLSDRDAEIVLVLDLLHEAGQSEGIAGAASVLDTTVRAAAAISDHYLRFGDRVSLLEYGRAARYLRPASGRRQYLTIVEWLLDVTCGACPHDPVGFGRTLSRIPSNALVIVLSPILDERSTATLARLVRSGRFTVAVDTLHGVNLHGVSLTRGGRTEEAGGNRAGGGLGIGNRRLGNPRSWSDVAHRLWLLERENTVENLRAMGVPVVSWTGAGSLDTVLRDVARLSAAPRAGRR